MVFLICYILDIFIILNKLKNKADILIVSITADKYVLKGPGKPYFNEKIRAHSYHL